LVLVEDGKKGVNHGRNAYSGSWYDILWRAAARHGSDQAVAVGAGIDSTDRDKVGGKAGGHVGARQPWLPQVARP
jgi:hypothetical protein